MPSGPWLKEKVVSFFEYHTDIIVKSRRETQYGHKVFLTGGHTGLVLDCIVERGNPSDTSLFPVLIERQERLYDRPPRQVSADGGFASQKNLDEAKKRGVKDVAFAKRKCLSVLDMVKSKWVYKQLKNFRAGIEANISRLKRSFGFSRCDWTGWLGFRSMSGAHLYLTTCWYWPGLSWRLHRGRSADAELGERDRYAC
jgi:IS5 family transposase